MSITERVPLLGRLTTGPTAPLWPLSFARVLLGLLWLGALRWKLPPDFDGGSERSVEQWLDLAVQHPTVDLYGRLLEQLVIPRPTPFLWLLFLAEATVGLSLLLGFRTRYGAAVGLAMSLNLGVAMTSVPGEWPWSYALMAMWHGTLLVSDTGRLWGLDGRRHRTTAAAGPHASGDAETDAVAGEEGQ